MRLLLFLLSLFSSLLGVRASTLPAKARVESCGGCKLNRLPEVRAFVYEDFEKGFERTHFKRMPGKSPELIFLDEQDNEISRIDIQHMDRKELNAIMRENGFRHKDDKENDAKEDENLKDENVESQAARPPTDEL